MNELNILREHVKPALLTRAWQRVQERVRDPGLRRQLSRVAGVFKGKAALQADSHAAATLKRDGIVQFPGFLSAREVAELREALNGFECFDPWRKEGGFFRIDSVPEGTHVGQIPKAPALERLHQLALDPRLLALAGEYFGCKPTLDCILAWWSFSGNDTAQEAELFHRDNDSIRFLKFFLYLTDVGPENGPHVFVKASHSSRRLLARRRIDDAEVQAEFPADHILSLTGHAGDAFLEDTYGLHKGQLPMAGKRLLVQFRYSVCESVWRSPVMTATPAAFDPQVAHSLIYVS